MARYVDKSFWEEEVLIPDTNTPVLGGQPVWEGDRLVDGFYNVPIAILADRTRNLKDRIEGVENEVIEGLEGFLVADENLADLEDIGQAKYNLGLNLVDNTPDLNKPISIPTQTALDQKVDKESGKGLSENDFTDADKEKLDGIAPEATKNATDAQLRDRATHTGEQPISSITGLQTALNSKVDVVPGKGLSSEDFTAADKMKLNGIEEGATANQTDAFLVDRANHTGTQAISTVSGLQSALDSKVDKVAGMGLSQENFTTAEKNKLALLEEPHFKGLFPTLADLEAAVPNPVPGDYAQVAGANPGDPSVTYVWDDPLNQWVEQAPEISAAQVKSLYESNPDTNAFTDSEKSKLAGIANGATANTGTVTSVGLTVPTGLSVSGSPITSSGTFGITFSTGYSIPTNAKQTQWDAAYGWGNHASVGYALASSLAPIATTGNWADISGKPAVIASGATQQEARDSIGAGTSNLSIGTTASTAKAGDWQPATATKAKVLEGTSTTDFVSADSYSKVISWEDLGAYSSGAVTIDLLDSLNFKFSVGGNVTIEAPQNVMLGKCGDIVITMTSSGSVSWDSNWKFLTSVPDIGESGEMWVISYKVLSSTEILASANKVAS